MKWAMCNVVWYDGLNAFVSKHILQVEDGEVTAQSEELVEKELQGNGELLKIDVQYPMDFDDIMALATDTDKERHELHLAIDRFKDMWF